MGIILILALLLLPIFSFFLISRVRKNGAMRLPPGPRGLPFVGNLHQLDNSFLHHQLWRLSQKYGPLMSLRLGSLQTLVVSSAKMAKEVMTTHDIIFCSRPSLTGQQTITYDRKDVAMSPYNDYWREMKKIITFNLFSSKRVQSFRPIREEEVSRMITQVSELANSSKLANLSEIIISLSMTIICRVAFSKRFDEGYEGSRLCTLLQQSKAVLMSFYVSDYFPLMGWIDRVSGLCGQLDKSFKEMDLFYQELIDEHLNPTDKKDSTRREDIVDIFLQIRNDESSTIDFTYTHMKAMFHDILFGGTDTSAVTVVWTMTELMKNPRVMEKAQEEVRKLIGEKGNVDEDDLQHLQYLTLVIKEAMRLHPPVPFLLPRLTMESCVIDGYDVKANTMVYINTYAIGRDPEFWKEPEKFMPERFMGSNSMEYKSQDFGWLGFGAGRRICPGILMGSTTVELILSNLLYSFDWELPTGMDKEDIDTVPLPGLIMHKKTPLCLLPKKGYN